MTSITNGLVDPMFMYAESEIALGNTSGSHTNNILEQDGTIHYRTITWAPDGLGDIQMNLSVVTVIPD